MPIFIRLMLPKPSFLLLFPAEAFQKSRAPNATGPGLMAGAGIVVR